MTHLPWRHFPHSYSTPKSRQPQRHFTKFTCCACCCPGPNLLMFPRTFNVPKVVSTCGQDHLRLWWGRTDYKRWNDTSLASPRVLPALAVRLIMKHSRLIGVGQILWNINKLTLFFCRWDEICSNFTSEDKKWLMKNSHISTLFQTCAELTIRCLAPIWTKWLCSMGRRNRTSVLSGTGVNRSAASFPPPPAPPLHPSSLHHSPLAATSHCCQLLLNCTKWRKVDTFHKEIPTVSILLACVCVRICFEGNHLRSNQQKGIFATNLILVYSYFARNRCKLRCTY